MFNQPSEKENAGAVCVREREKKTTTTMGVAGAVDGFAFWATDSILSLFLLNTDGMRQNEYLTIYDIHSGWTSEHCENVIKLKLISLLIYSFFL